MMNRFKVLLISHLLILVLLVLSCSSRSVSSEAKKESAPRKEQIVFSSDSAYRYIEQQLSFGMRVPGTDTHAACALFLKSELERHGGTTRLQTGEMTRFDGKKTPVSNIISSINPQLKNRILLCAHWDSREWADHDPDPQKRLKPVPGANDGASGVGVLLEIARQIGNGSGLSMGVDIVLFDTEDQGTPLHYKGKESEHPWCLGAQYWATKAVAENYKATYGILLDMVGAPDAVFYKDGVSMHFAPSVVNRVWKKAEMMGYGRYFINKQEGMITDDHLYVNQIARIPCIDIIHYDTESETGFPFWWHTTSDDLTHISKQTLEAVGRVVLSLLYDTK